MFLEKLEIQGFKSFANKNKLIFPGRKQEHRHGLTAIVGPNGSGKSNVADAVRWALGEQSLKTLRGKKSEDVIFSGSDQKQRLSLAEVSLYLNNTDTIKNGVKQPENINGEKDLDQLLLSCPEIVITRRLYRNGDSEYLLNNGRVRLSDVQMFLAKANFGQKTYSVIGQGLVENFLSSSATERKDFFDEATGIKQFQIKRDAALNKLENSYTNLQQVSMLLTEIKPRLKSLTRSVEKLKRRDEIEQKLQAAQINYYGHLWQDSNQKLEVTNQQLLKQEKTLRDKEGTLIKLNEDLEKIRLRDNRSLIETLLEKLKPLHEQKNFHLKELARLRAEKSVRLEARGQFDLAWINNKKEDLQEELKALRQESGNKSSGNQDEIKRRQADLEALNKRLDNLNKELSEINRSLSQSDDLKNERNKELNRLISDLIKRLEEIEASEDLILIKKIISEIKAEWAAKGQDLNNDQHWQRAGELQTEILKLSEARQLATDRLNEEKLRLAAAAEKDKLFILREEQLLSEIAALENKIKTNSGQIAEADLDAEKNRINTSLAQIEEKISTLEKEQAEINRAHETEKAQMYSCQQAIQAEQETIKNINQELGALRVAAAREETRLEDLEANWRRDGLSLQAIKQYQGSQETIELAALQKEIAMAKQQLEQIGGIDPETEKEYQETKERYDFLSEQTDDLSNTIDSLEEVISTLDKNIKLHFDSEFKIISEKFQEYFKILFNGGTAKISKIMADEIESEDKKNNISSEQNDNLKQEDLMLKQAADLRMKKIRSLKKHNAVGLAGIDIQATPPGKKINSVAMLSGGERALTAIALICAIISANPSPFVVLDEVDAALDEANSQRLAKILDDLSHKTQFITITHNRTCMRQASVLYGVTMESDGVSKLLSVKMDDLKK